MSRTCEQCGAGELAPGFVWCGDCLGTAKAREPAEAVLAEAVARVRRRAEDYARMAATGFVRGEEHRIERCKLISQILDEVADQLEGAP